MQAKDESERAGTGVGYSGNFHGPGGRRTLDQKPSCLSGAWALTPTFTPCSAMAATAAPTPHEFLARSDDPDAAEYNPRVVFERLFGDVGTTSRRPPSPAEKERSVLDSVTEGHPSVSSAASSLYDRRSSRSTCRPRARSNAGSRTRSSKRIGNCRPSAPAGIPTTYEEHAKFMFELRSRRTDRPDPRHLLHGGRELSGRRYPQIGVTDPHTRFHTTRTTPSEDREARSKINVYHIWLF